MANPAVVTADGEGLTSGKVNHRSSFVISTAQDTAANDVAVQVKCKSYCNESQVKNTLSLATYRSTPFDLFSRNYFVIS